MGKIAELWETIRNMKKMFRYALSDCTVTYTLNVFGMRAKGKSIWIYALLPVFLGVAYIGCAISLFAFDTLLGIPEFSWTNAFWWMIVIATCMTAFNRGD